MYNKNKKWWNCLCWGHVLRTIGANYRPPPLKGFQDIKSTACGCPVDTGELTAPTCSFRGTGCTKLKDDACGTTLARGCIIQYLGQFRGGPTLTIPPPDRSISDVCPGPSRFLPFVHDVVTHVIVCFQFDW
jgi:hypothetical protein